MELDDRPLSGRDRALALDWLLAIVTFTETLEWARFRSRRRPSRPADRAADLWASLAAVERLAYHLGAGLPTLTDGNGDPSERDELLRDGARHIGAQELSRRLSDLHRRLMDYYPAIGSDAIETCRRLALALETGFETPEMPLVVITEYLLTLVNQVRSRVPDLF